MLKTKGIEDIKKKKGMILFDNWKNIQEYQNAEGEALRGKNGL